MMCVDETGPRFVLQQLLCLIRIHPIFLCYVLGEGDEALCLNVDVHSSMLRALICRQINVINVRESSRRISLSLKLPQRCIPLVRSFERGVLFC